MALNKSMLSPLFADVLTEANSNPTPPKSFMEVLEEDVLASGSGSLAERFIVPPFSFLDARHSRWPLKQRKWIPVFDPLLCEIVYSWFAPEGGIVFDPFGDATRGIVAGCCGHSYVGIVPSKKAMNANGLQARLVRPRFPEMKLPRWVCTDFPRDQKCDLVFTDIPLWGKNDITPTALKKMEGALIHAAQRLNKNRFMVFVARQVGGDDEILFWPEKTIQWATRAGLHYYNRMVLGMSGNIHEMIYCFFNGRDARQIPKELGVLNHV